MYTFTVLILPACSETFRWYLFCQILSNLEPFRTIVKDVAVCAGREYLLEQLPPDEDIFDIELNARVFNRNASLVHFLSSILYSLFSNFSQVTFTKLTCYVKIL